MWGQEIVTVTAYDDSTDTATIKRSATAPIDHFDPPASTQKGKLYKFFKVRG